MRVAAAPPVCTVNIDTDTRSVEEYSSIKITCKVVFRGLWNPLFECNPEESAIEDYTTLTKSLTYTKTMNVTRKLQNARFACSMKFSQISNSSNIMEAVNYNYQWISAPMNVLCKFY